MYTNKAKIRKSPYFCCPHSKFNKFFGILLALALTIPASSNKAQANPLNWIKSKVLSHSSKRSSGNEANFKIIPGQNNSYEIQRDSAVNLTGGNLDSYTFSQSHWVNSKKLLSSMCKTLVRINPDNKIKDIARKLYVIDVQGFKESVKTPSLAMKDINSQNKQLKNNLMRLNQIVSAPQQETLADFDKAISQLKYINYNQAKLIRKYLKGAEGLISLGSQSYETLELIPSMSNTTLDLFVQASKRLMKQMQSNGESFKGILLNLQNSSEQITSNLDLAKSIVKSTLRFSDHFAIKQFPLINLPTPSREKVFVQIKTLKNAINGVSNTLSICDSQIRNSAQQFAHLIQGLTAKANESFKYTRPNSNSEQDIAQISVYAQNQISGLFLRTKEILRSTHTEMAKAMSDNGNNNMSPSIAIESKADYMVKRTISASQNKLPLFLLGGKNKAVSNDNGNEMIALSNPVKRNAKVDNVSSITLYKEDEPENFTEKKGLMPTEVNIIQQELGQNFFSDEVGKEESETVPDNSENMEIQNDQDDPASENYSDEEPLMKISYDNLNVQTDPEIQLLKFDSISDGEESDD